MNTETVIKALEIHSNWEMPCVAECPYGHRHRCGSAMASDALALIKELLNKLDMLEKDSTVRKLTEENERLKAQNETLKIYNKDYEYRNKEFLEANEGLANNLEELEIEGDELRERIANLKKENKYLRERLAEEAEIKEDVGEILVAQINISEQDLKKLEELLHR